MVLIVLAPVAFAGGEIDAIAVDGIGIGTASGSVAASFDSVVAVLDHCGEASAWLPNTRWSDQERLDAATSLCSGVTNLPWPIPDRTWTVRSVASTEADTWTLAYVFVPGSGNLSQMDGSWVVTPDEHGTHVDFEIHVALDVPVPVFLLKWATRRVLDGVLDGLEAQALGS